MLIKLIKRKQWVMFRIVLASVVMGCAVVPLLVMSRQRTQLPSNRIVFSWNRDGDFDLYLMDADSLTVVNQLTDNAASDLTPAWSPDGTRVALTSNVDKNYEIYVIDVTTGESDVLTNNNWDDLYPAWSPNGKQIAFTTNRDSNWDIYVMDADGQNPKRLTSNAVYEGNPVWSPDGKQIAYVEGRDADRNIMVMNADGGNPQPLTTRRTSADYSPAWSPKGDQIAFVSNRNGNPDIFVVDVGCIGNSDTCDQLAVDLTSDNRGDDVDPAWSPDGTQLVFASVHDTATDLYTMAADGSGLARITSGDGQKRFPSWWMDQ